MARAKLNRETVLTAAADMADREGFDAITVSALARHLGVQPASLYSHVRDRAAVLDGVHELALGELADRIGAAIAGRSGRQALIGFADAHRDYAREHPGRWAAMERPATRETVRSDAANRLVSLMWAVFRGYELPEPELVHVTRFVGATINGFLALQKVEAFDHRSPEVDVSWARAIDAIDAVLRRWPGQGEEGAS